MITQLRQTTEGYLADINGATWQIKELARFWPEVQAYIAAGGEVLPQYTLDDLRQKKHEEIKQAFEAELEKGYLATDGIKYDCTKVSLNDWDMLDRRIDRENLTTIYPRDYNNVTHQRTIAQYRAVLNELGQHFDTNFFKKNTLQDQAKTATEEQLAVIRW